MARGQAPEETETEDEAEDTVTEDTGLRNGGGNPDGCSQLLQRQHFSAKAQENPTRVGGGIVVDCLEKFPAV